MAERVTLSRRAALTGALTLPVAIAVPVSVQAATNLRPSVLDLIERHRAAFEALEQATNALEIALQAPNRPEVRVVVGRDAESWEPIYARDIVIIRKYANQRRMLSKVWRVKQAIDPDQWEADRLAELEAAQRAEQEWWEASGASASETQQDQCFEAERTARLDLLLCRPVTAAEAEAKRAYVASSEPFLEEWGTELSFQHALIERLCMTA